jgi:hypothetical protein
MGSKSPYLMGFPVPLPILCREHGKRNWEDHARHAECAALLAAVKDATRR